MAYKPGGYTSVAPYLTVNGAQKLRMIPGDAGQLAHAEVRIGDTVVMLTDATAGWPAVAAHVHVYVPDVDATYALAIAAGATAVKPPTVSDDADKRGGFQDPGSTTWWVSTQMAEA